MVYGSAISITGGANATIHVVGKNNTVKSGNGAGIYVASDSSVTIKGNSRYDTLTATAGGMAAGIGSRDISESGSSCGDITIRNVTVSAYGSGSIPGIGASDRCGVITIENATVYAYGIEWAHAIGSQTSSDPPEIKISGSEIYAYRGAYEGSSYADWIGIRDITSPSGAGIKGDITDTVVHKNTYECSTDPPIEVEGETVTYDSDGNVVNGQE